MIRFDRSISLILARVTTRYSKKGDAESLPVLMYHSVSTDSESGLRPYYKLCVSPSRFANQLEWLAGNGWKGMTLSEALAAQRNGFPSDTKPVAITFDDGFRDFYEQAYPLLSDHNFTATMYLPTKFIGKRSAKRFKSHLCMTWAEVSELDSQGIEFGSHTCSHPRLEQLTESEIKKELVSSKAVIEDSIGHSIRSFAYPYAYPQANKRLCGFLESTLHEAGYKNMVTTIIGRSKPNGGSYAIPRIPVNEEDDCKLLAAKMSGHYDWLGFPQALTKTAKRIFRPNNR